MALDSDLIKQHQINQPSTPTEPTVAGTTTGASVAAKPVQIVPDTSVQETKKPVELSDEAIAKQNTAAEESRVARARSHESDVDEIAKIKAASVSNTDSDVVNAGISKEYIDIIKDENAKPKEKVRNLLKAFYSKNAPEFAQLSNEEQNKIAEQKISELISKLNPDNENLSPKDVLQSYMKISLLLLKADKDGVSLDSLSDKPIEELNIMLKKSKKEIFAHFVDNLQNETPEKVLRESIRMYMSVTDVDFASKSKKEQDEIIKNTKEKFSESFGLKGSTEQTKERLKNYGINILKYLIKNDISVEDFSKMSSTEQEKIMVEVATSPDIYDNVDKKTQEKLDYYITLRSTCLALGEGEYTWGEVLEYYENLNKDGNLADEEVVIYEQLKKDIENNIFKPDEKVSFKSNLVNALLGTNDIESDDTNASGGLSQKMRSMNELVKDYINDVLGEIEPNSDLSDEQLMGLIERANNDGYLDGTNSLIALLKQKGWSDEQLGKITARIDALKHLAHCDNDEGVSAAEFSDNISLYGTQAQIDEAKQAIDIIIPDRNDEFASDYLAGLKHDNNRVFTDAATSALNRDVNRTDEQRLNIYKMAIENSSPDRQAIITQSSIETASREQKIYYGEQYSHINNAAVTEGLAAATHNETDSNTKSLLSTYVDNAIQNNGYSSDEIKNINTARETGQTSYERNSVSSDSSKTSTADSTSSTNSKTQTANNATANPASAQTSNATAKATTSAASATPVKVKVSPANFNAVMEMKAQIAQVNYEHSIALRDKALADLERIMDKIQNDQEVRAQKQAELAAKEAKTDEEIAQAIKDADTKSVEQQDKAQKEVAKEVIEELEQEEKLEKKYNIPIETINELRAAQRQGDLSKVYSKLGSISIEAQKHFIQYLSRKDTATIIGFIRSRSSDKSLIKELCKLNPSLIKALDANMLLDCGIAKADIIKYSDSHQLSVLMYDLAKTGNTRELNQFYDALGDDAQQVASPTSIPVPGDDRYFAWLNGNMSAASQSNKVAMRQDINKKVPRELWG